MKPSNDTSSNTLKVATPRGDQPRLLLLRHGQASLGTDDYDRLSDLGRRQAMILGARLESLGVRGCSAVAGSLKRQQQTLDSLGVSGPVSIDESLNEYVVDQLIRSAVEYAHKSGTEVPRQEAFADPKAYLETFLSWFPTVLSMWQAAELYCAHNGRWSDFHARVTSPIPAWREQLSSGQSLIVVSSAGVISTAVSDMLGEDLSWQRSLNVRLYNASLTELILDSDERWRAVRINCVDHLEAEAVTLA